MRVVGMNINSIWGGVIGNLLATGDRVAPRGMPVIECRGATLELLDPRANMTTNIVRAPNYHFMVAEWLWMLYGHRDVRTIHAFNKQIAAFSDDGRTFFGAYGPQIVKQLPAVLDLLRRDVDTRQAVLAIWRPEALTHATRDVPCTLTWQFFIRRNCLEMHVHMRSNDVWLGLPYDVFNFTQFQRLLADALDVGIGRYVHHVGSLHLYKQNAAAAMAALDATVDGISPFVLDPVWPPPGELNEVMTELAADRMTLPEARAIVEHLPASWLNYGRVVIHRFSKDDSDLGAPGTVLRQRIAP